MSWFGKHYPAPYTDDGMYEPQAVNPPIDAFLNINSGLHGDEGVIDEVGEVVDPFGGE